MYHVWESRRRQPAEVLVPRFAPTLKEQGVSFLAARRFERQLPELEIRYAAPDGAVLTDDLVIRRRRCLAHSERLIEVLRDAGVDNIDYHPLRLVNETTGAVCRSHRAANILDVIHCLDEAQSELERDDEEPHEIWTIHRLKLIEERLGDVPLFRLGERPSTVIVHERVKQAVEAAGMTGVVFLPADGYREYMGWSSANPRNVIGTHDLDPDGPADKRDGAEDSDADEGASDETGA